MKRLLACALLSGATSAAYAAEDSRSPVDVTPAQQAMVLEEMRDYVAALQGITGALARDDFAAAADAARTMGRSRMTGDRMRMAKSLPEDFRMLGMSVHEDFDAIARDAEAVRDAAHSLEQLSGTLGKCVGCHAAYRLKPR